jgi:hypothetical protein
VDLLQITQKNGSWSVTAGPLLLIILVLVVIGVVWQLAQAYDRVRVTKVKVNLPFGIGDVEMQADPREREAAWKLYVELMSRITVQPLGPEEGLPREALTSLYTIYERGREILKDAGPGEHQGAHKLGETGLRVLNEHLRRFLAYWHPALEAWEEQPQPRPPWQAERDFRVRLASLQIQMEHYAIVLAGIARVSHTPIDRSAAQEGMGAEIPPGEAFPSSSNS